MPENRSGNSGTRRPAGSTSGNGGTRRPAGSTSGNGGTRRPAGSTSGNGGTRRPAGSTSGNGGTRRPAGSASGNNGTRRPAGSTSGNGGTRRPAGSTSGNGGTRRPAGSTSGNGGTRRPAGSTSKKKSAKRNKKKINIKLIAAIGAGAVAVIAGGTYVGFSMYYQNHFFPKSTINGESVAKKTQKDADEALATAACEYSFNVITRTGLQYVIKGEDIDYVYEESGSVSEFLDDQNGWSWLSEIGKEHEYSITTSTFYDEDKLAGVVDKLTCFDENKQTPPSNAKVEKRDGVIQIIQENQGDTIIKETAVDLIMEAVKSGEASVTLTDDCYEKPSITSTSKEITDIMDQVNKCYSTTITYTIGEDTEVIDADTIKSWVNIDSKGNVFISENGPADYAQKLASKYNTYGDTRQFKTTKGDTISIGGGDYGWVVDKPKEAAQIIEDVKTGGDIVREPIYSQVAQVPGLDDIGDTYVEVDYTNQHVYFYKKGELVFESDVVTGNLSRGNGSPDGVYKIVYKKSPATLVGEGYSSSVTYFMVFAYNVGFHDATWRSAFGGQIYKTSGSHGCVNMPKAKAKELYSILEENTPVIAYYREPVTLTAENAKISNAYSYKSS